VRFFVSGALWGIFFYSCRSMIAMMELHWNKEAKIAMNVFEHGLKTFGDDIDYVIRYLDFLIITNDDASQSPFFRFVSVYRLAFIDENRGGNRRACSVRTNRLQVAAGHHSAVVGPVDEPRGPIWRLGLYTQA
jgi:hypothetical protein